MNKSTSVLLSDIPRDYVAVTFIKYDRKRLNIVYQVSKIKYLSYFAK